MARRLIVDPGRPEASLLDQAARAIAAGGLIAYPTDTLYGLGADALNERALGKLFALKGRRAGEPIPLIIGSREQLRTLTSSPTRLARRLMDCFWPGPLTLVLEPRGSLSPLITGGGGVGVRLPRSPIAQGLALRAGTPLTATSANRSGEPPLLEAASIEEAFGAELALILDGGPLGKEGPPPLPSTVVDARGEEPVLLREGAVAFSEIEEALRKKG